MACVRRAIRSLATSVILAFGASGCGEDGPGPPPLEVVVLRERAAAAFAEERWDVARTALEEVLASEHGGPVDEQNLAFVELADLVADSAVRAGQEARARELLERAEDSDPSLPGVHYGLGVLARRDGDSESAARAFARAAELAPDDPASRVMLAAARTDLGDRAGAERELRAVIERGAAFGGSFHLSALHRLGQLLLRSRDPEKTKEALALLEEKARIEAGGVRAPNEEELERGRLASVTAPAPAPARGAPPGAATPVFEAGPVLLADVGRARDLTAFDVDDDGRLDLVAAGAGGVRVAMRRPTQGREGVEEAAVTSAPAERVVAGDLDNDGRASLLALSAGSARLATITPRSTWRDDTASLPADLAAVDACFVDLDHEGDLDVALATDGGLRVLRTDGAEVGGGATRFTEISDALFVADAPRSSVRWVAALDADVDGDVDLLLGSEDGVVLASNLREGRFSRVDLGLPLAAKPALADLDHDGRVDVFDAAGGRFVRNLGGGRFGETAPTGVAAPGRAVLADLDRNGEDDLVWAADTAVSARLGSLLGDGPRDMTVGRVEGVASIVDVADLDGDADLDVTVGLDRGVSILRCADPGPSRALSIDLEALKDNRGAIGARVEVRAGALYQCVQVSRTPLVIGVGGHDVDVVRVTWPNGVVQHALDAALGGPLVLRQPDRLSGSCPFLYTFDGERFRFVTDVLGAAPLGLPAARGMKVVPNPAEWVRVPGDWLRERDGTLEIAITEELREVTYLDRVELIAVDHPADAQVHPEERFAPPPFPPKRLHAMRDVRPLAAAIGGDGRDWTAELRAIDGAHAAPFSALPPQFQGLATRHHLDLSLPEEARDAARIRLLLTGWFYWSDASVNLAAFDHPRHAFEPPTLFAPDAVGRFRAAGPLGFPTGKTKTMVVDVTGLVRRDDLRLRIASNLRLYWDCIEVALDGEDVDVVTTRVEPREAEVRYRGFSAPTYANADDQPERFDYDRLDGPRWNQHAGMLTRYGDVTPLLTAVDDRFCVFSAGDEVRVRFPALPPPPPGHARTWLVHLDGYAKDGDANTTASATVEPLPFHAMSTYPPGDGERSRWFDDDPSYPAEWNTRPGRRLLPSLVVPPR